MKALFNRLLGPRNKDNQINNEEVEPPQIPMTSDVSSCKACPALGMFPEAKRGQSSAGSEFSFLEEMKGTIHHLISDKTLNA